jgi:hypothetical protein
VKLRLENETMNDFWDLQSPEFKKEFEKNHQISILGFK